MRHLNARWFGILILACLMVLLIDASWIRLQYWLTGGFLLPAAALKPLVALASIAGALWFGSRLPRHAITAVSIVALSAFVANVANLVWLQGIPWRDVSVEHNAYYWPFYLLPLVLLFANAVPRAAFERLLLWVGAPLAAFGLLQFVSQRPFLEIALPDASFVVNAWRFHGTGQVRAFSLFGSGQTFGYLLALLAPALLVYVLRARGAGKIAFSALFAVVLAATAATLTRNTYVVVAMALVASFAYLTVLRRWAWLLPALYCGLAGLAAGAAAAFGLPETIGGVLDTTSLVLRWEAWAEHVGRFAAAPPSAQLLGLGLVQNDQVAEGLRVLVDNAFLAVLLQHGWLGLLTWFVAMWVLWAYVHDQAVRGGGAGAIALAAAFSTWPIVGLFNVTVATFAHLALFAVVVSPLAASPARRTMPRFVWREPAGRARREPAFATAGHDAGDAS